MNNKYKGSECIVCHEKFTDADDVVVCPDCGTPYHRECWEREGKCINTELHESGMFWSEKEKPDADETGTVRCIRCGAENPSDTKFCKDCGMPLMNFDVEQRPFNEGSTGGVTGGEFNNAQNGGTNDFTPFTDGMPPFGGIKQVRLTNDSDLDGVKLGDYYNYTGGSFTMLANFVKFAKTTMKSSFNIFALFLPEYYLFYRKMYVKGLIILILNFLLKIPMFIVEGQTGFQDMVLFDTGINIKSEPFLKILRGCTLLAVIIKLIVGFSVNYWYYKKARMEIIGIRSRSAEVDDGEEEKIRERIMRKGGTTWSGAVGAVLLATILELAFMLVMAIVF